MAPRIEDHDVRSGERRRKGLGAHVVEDDVRLFEGLHPPGTGLLQGDARQPDVIAQVEECGVEEEVGAVADERDLQRFERGDHGEGLVVEGGPQIGAEPRRGRLGGFETSDEPGPRRVEVGEHLARDLLGLELQNAASDADAVGLHVEDDGCRSVAQISDLGQHLDLVAIVGVAAGGERRDGDVGGVAFDPNEAARDGPFDAGAEGRRGGWIERSVGQHQDPGAGAPTDGVGRQGDRALQIRLPVTGDERTDGGNQHGGFLRQRGDDAHFFAGRDHQRVIGRPQTGDLGLGPPLGLVEARQALGGPWGGHARGAVDHDRQVHRFAQPHIRAGIAERQADEGEQDHLHQPRQEPPEPAPDVATFALPRHAFPQRREWNDDLASSHPEQVQHGDRTRTGGVHHGELREGPSREAHCRMPPCRKIRRTRSSKGTSIGART